MQQWERAVAGLVAPVVLGMAHGPPGVGPSLPASCFWAGSSHQAAAPMAPSNTSKPYKRKGRGRGRQGAVQQQALVSLPAGTRD